jgi:Flavodoxins
MKSIHVMYFSGTNNTEIVADMIAANFRERGCAVRMEKIGKEKGALAAPDGSVLDEKDPSAVDEILGIGAPVIGLGTPSLVLKFIRNLPAGNGKKVFIFRTAGGVVPGNYNASRDAMALLKKKGYDIFTEQLFSIGSNWVIRFSNDAMRTLHDATQLKVKIFCAEILAGKRHRYETGKKRRLIDAFLRGISRIGLRFLAVDFKIGSACSACGLCSERCPAANIRMRHGKPRFGADCASCMRCVYACPRNAISMHTLGFLQVKGGYDVREILEHPEQWSDEGTKANPPFMATYIADARQ